MNRDSRKISPLIMDESIPIERRETLSEVYLTWDNDSSLSFNEACYEEGCSENEAKQLWIYHKANMKKWE